VDPLTRSYPWYTPYQFAGNTPIQAIDLEGAEPKSVVDYKENSGSEKGFTKPVIFLFKEVNGIPERISESANILVDQWYHDKITGYTSGAITLGDDIVFTENYRTKTTRVFLELAAHEVIHSVQFHRDFNQDLAAYLSSYGLSSAWQAGINLTTDPNKLHDKIPAEKEANRFENQFEAFLGFYDQYDSKGNPTGNNSVINILDNNQLSDEEKVKELTPLVERWKKTFPWFCK
jgi:hypothetical protein